ncbi:MAG: GAF domain-containing protein, partial [Dehalococcoidia bacterium]
MARERQAGGTERQLAEIGRRIAASLDIGEVLQTVVRAARRLVDADLGCIALQDNQGALVMNAADGNRTEAFCALVLPAGRGVGGRVLASGRPQQIDGYLTSRRVTHDPGIDEAVAGEGIVSALVLPIQGVAGLLGVFVVAARTPRRFGRQKVALLRRLAAQAAIAIETAHGLAREQAARAEVEALLTVTSSLGIQSDPESVIQTIVISVARLLDAERSSYVIRNNDQAVSIKIWQSGAWLPDLVHASLSGSILGHVLQSGLPYRSNDLATDPISDHALDAQIGLRSQLTAPLIAPGGEWLGLISAFNSRRPGGFGERDERLLLATCEYAGAVLQRAHETSARLQAKRQAAQRKREVEALLTAAERLNSAMEPEELLRQMVEVATELIAVKYATIVMKEGDHARGLHAWNLGTWASTGTHLPIEGSISGWVIQHARAYRSDDLPADPLFYWPAGEPIPRMSLSVPILARDARVLGVLNL